MLNSTKKCFSVLALTGVSLMCSPLWATAERDDPGVVAYWNNVANLIESKRYKEAEKILEKALRDDYEDACYYMGMLHVRKGEKEKALFYFRKGAALEEINSMFKLAQLYALGWGVAKNEAEAFRLLKKTADRSGYPEAIFQTGRMLLVGEGTSPDRSKAVYYLKQVSDPRCGTEMLPQAQHLLGTYFLEEAEKCGETGRKKELFADAVRILRLAAANKVSGAWISLGGIYYNGSDGSKPDPEKAVLCYLAAVAIDAPVKAHYNLGVIALQNKDYDEALRWMQLAAAQGDPQAKHFVEKDYPKLKGVRTAPEKKSSRAEKIEVTPAM